jgi:hypothetical protein
MSNRRRAAILKDFSELKPLETRIQMLAIGIYQIQFRGEAHEDFEPKNGTQVHRVWRMKKLEIRQQIAWQIFLDDVNLAHGKSGGVSSSYGEYHDKGNGDEFKVPTAYANVYYRRVEQLLMQHLSRSERALVADLLQDTLKADSSLQIETIGLVRSGYQEKVSARASGVTRVQMLLDRMADFYGV